MATPFHRISRPVALFVATAFAVASASQLRAQLDADPKPPVESPALSPQPSPRTSTQPLPEEVFLEAWNVVNVAFFDPNFNGADWPAVRDELLPAAKAADTPAALSRVINDALSHLHTSHSGHFTRDQREYYELLDVFFPDGVPRRRGSSVTPGAVRYVGIGLVAQVIDGRTFVADVYETGPAAKAGILPGDELIGVEDGPWGDIAPFRGREGKDTRVIVQRTADAAGRWEATVVPESIQPREMFLAAMKAGAHVIKKDGRRIAYVRVRSYAHSDYHDLLKELIASEFADALIIDLRGGWGGAQPSYMDIFNPTAPRLDLRSRDGKHTVVAPTWSRPAAVLIDGGTRSGKEILAYAMKKHHVATLVGERTAGAVVAGTSRSLADGSFLYVAVSDVKVDGVRLEGVGVEPDVPAARNLPYSAGEDPQIDAAADVLVRQLDQK